MSGRPKAEPVLSTTEHAQFTALTPRRKTNQAQALRLRIVLACAQSNKVVAAHERVKSTLLKTLNECTMATPY